MDNYYPFEYKRGYINFLKCKIGLTPKCFIPERETRVWVKRVINRIKNQPNLMILDIFAGSGCIGIAVLKYVKSSKVIFAEIDKGLIRQIKFNLRLNRIDSRRYEVVQSDIFRNVKRGFDYIFANPPYIAEKNKHLIQDSVYDFEPHKALFGGKDGLFLIRRFLKDARKYLKKDGKIYMEFDHLQKRELEDLLKKLKYKKYRIYKDQFKKYRWICIEN